MVKCKALPYLQRAEPGPVYQFAAIPAQTLLEMGDLLLCRKPGTHKSSLCFGHLVACLTHKHSINPGCGECGEGVE